MDKARQRLRELSTLLQRQLGSNLLGLYLFGSLAVGDFHPARSDLDLLAVLDSPIEAEQHEALDQLLTEFVATNPAWQNRIEIGFISREVLQTFPERPRGTIAAVSPGEPFHAKDVEADWVLNWHGVCTQGEVVLGPPPLELGPQITAAAYKRAVAAQLAAWQQEIRHPWVAYVPAHQGYIVVTVCPLYALETGEHATKESAVSWAAERYPDWAEFIREALTAHRADYTDPHTRAIGFVDLAVADTRPTT